MIQVIREANGLLTISGDEQLYTLQCGDTVIIANQRPKSAQVYFWTEEDWEKELKRRKRAASRVTDEKVKE